MSLPISERVTSNLVDVAAICGITLVKLPTIVHALVALGVGLTLIVKNVFDILKKKEEYRHQKMINDKHEEDSRIITKI